MSEFDVSREPGSQDVSFRIVLGRGGAMRSIAHDFGRSLGTVSHLKELRREAVGKFSVKDAWTLDVLLPVVRKFRKMYSNAVA